MHLSFRSRWFTKHKRSGFESVWSLVRLSVITERIIQWAFHSVWRLLPSFVLAETISAICNFRLQYHSLEDDCNRFLFINEWCSASELSSASFYSYFFLIIFFFSSCPYIYSYNLIFVYFYIFFFFIYILFFVCFFLIPIIYSFR